jgi:hypothetical protein
MISKMGKTFVLVIFLILFFAGMSAITSNYGDGPDMIGQGESIDYMQEIQHFSQFPKGIIMTA